MIKYIVTWVAVTTVIVPYKPKLGEYGLKSSNVFLAVASYEYHKEIHSKEFDTLEEVKKFIENMPQKDTSKIGFIQNSDGYCEDIKVQKIEEIKLKELLGK